MEPHRARSQAEVRGLACPGHNDGPMAFFEHDGATIHYQVAGTWFSCFTHCPRRYAFGVQQMGTDAVEPAGSTDR